MKKQILIGAAIALGLAVGGQQAVAQTKTHTETVTKETGPDPNTKTKTEIVTGKVTEYEAGKEIEIEGPEGKNHEFDLDENARIEGTITVGEMATVEYTKTEDGTERVAVIAAGGKAPAKGTASHAHGEHGQPAASTGSRMHVESATKRTGPGPNAKTKHEIVVGVVKEYRAGKEIEIEGPNGKSYEFDLDEQVAVKGAVAVGQRARVEYTKGANGVERVMILTHEAAKPDPKKKS